MIEYALDADGIATVTWDLPGRPVNVLSMDARLTFIAVTEAALNDPAVKGVIITSAKKEFIAGADLTLLQTFRGKPAAEIMGKMSALRDFLRRMETAGKPVVAAMNGTALGGGLEICLACHHRIAVDRPDALFGLPEAGLGLLPGAGGSQRLPRLIGIKAALPLMLDGSRVSAARAKALGFIDEVVAAEELLPAARAWILAHPKAAQPWDQPGFVPPGGDISGVEMNRWFMALDSKVHAETKGNFPAPRAILSCVYEGLRVPIDVGLAIEFRYLVELVRGDVAQNTIRTFFFSMNDARKLKGRPPAPASRFSKIGILGAGTMGVGVAQVAAEGGLEVVLLDQSLEAAQAAVAKLATSLERLVAKGITSAQTRAAVLERIHPTADYADLSGCQAIIEAVFEDRAIKDDVIRKTLAVTGSEVLFGSNTSKLPITQLAYSTDRPDRFIGLHFFSPVPRMALLEIIRGAQTSDATVAEALDLSKVLGRTPIVVNDGPGFFTSRCVSTYLNEGIALLREGVSPALIENVGRQAGMPMGPLTLGDGIGIDTMHKVRVQEGRDKGDAWVPGVEFEVVEHLAGLGRYGMKNGKGFYDYAADGSKALWPELATLYPVAAEQPTPEAVRTRLLHVQAVEAARCFAEGVIADPRHADIGSVLGWSFAKHTGGVCSYMDTIGVARFVAECDALADTYGERFRPPAYLRDLADRGRGFYDDAA